MGGGGGGGAREAHSGNKPTGRTINRRQLPGRPAGRHRCLLAARPPALLFPASKPPSHLEWEFRSDSISRCFCCWRLVRPAGDPAAEDDALLAKGKSQLILLGSRPEALEASGLLLLAQPSLSGATEHGRHAEGSRAFSPTPNSPSPWPPGGTSFHGGWLGKNDSPRPRVPGPLASNTKPAGVSETRRLPGALRPGVRPSPARPALPSAPPPRRLRHHAAPSPGRARCDGGALGSAAAAPLSPFQGERCLWGARCRRRSRHRRCRRRRRVLSLWRGGRGGARAQRHK